MPEHPTDDPRAGRSRGAARSSLDDRLRAEAVRVMEGDAHRPLRDPAAERAAVEEGGDFETRVVARARHLPVAPELDRSIRHLRAGITWAVVLGLALALLLGAGTARSTMAGVDGTRINFYWVLGGVLAIQTLLLLAWVVVASRWGLGGGERARGSPMLVSLGRGVMGVGRWLGERTRATDEGHAVVQAGGRLMGTGRLGFWTFSSLTHALWVGFNVGALGLLLLLLSARQYTFVWETTILSEEHYVAMTEALNVPASLAGFTVPTRDDIVESQWTGLAPRPAPEDPPVGDPADRSQRWASLLVASIVLYGLGPRLFLLLLSLALRRRAARSLRLDTTLPEYERLRPILWPTTRSLGVVDPDAGGAGGVAGGDGAAARPPIRPAGPPAAVGLEIAPPAVGWPPALDGMALRDLGIVESREERAGVVERLESAEDEPSPLVIVCELTTTPDRGMGRALEALRRTVSASPLLVLTAGQALRDRGYDAEQVQRRVDDWSELAVRAGVDPASIVAADLDHLTDAAASRLVHRLGADGNDPAGGRTGIDGAFASIGKHAARWEERGRVPTESDQVELHREIAGHYRESAATLRSFFDLSPHRARAPLEEARAGAERFVALLPPRLRESRRWLAAGALAGAVGCMATAAMTGPLAVATLPSWSAIGAAAAAALQGSGGEAGPDPAVTEGPDLSDGVRAGALFAVTLELQGHDEGTITRVLDRTFIEDPGPDPDEEERVRDAASASDWLGEVRHRFDRALAEEVGP